MSIRAGLALVQLLTGAKPWAEFRTMKDLAAAFATKVRAKKSLKAIQRHSVMSFRESGNLAVIVRYGSTKRQNDWHD